MSISCIESAFNNDENPSREVIEFIQSISMKKSNKKEVERDFLHLLNIISNTNKEVFLPKIEKNIKMNWNNENKNIFIKIIFNQPLYTQIFLEIFFFFTDEVQKDILFQISHTALEVKHSVLFGKFLAYLYQNQKNTLEDVKNICESKIMTDPGFVISFLCEMNKIVNKELKLYSRECIERIQEKKIDTKILMLVFDLQSILED